MKKLYLVFISLGLSFTLSVQAADLKTVFTAAQQSDPTYQGAEATYKATAANQGIAKAQLLPNLALNGSWTHANMTTHNSANFGGYPSSVSYSVPTDALAYSLTLTQPLFNWQAFAAYDQIKATVKAGAATYAAAAQNLITRTATAYFAVLQAQEVLRYSDAQKLALNRQLQVAKQRYEVGLDPITSVYDAQASYDTAVALYIQNENNLSNQKEALRQITGQLYPNLARLKDNFPLLQPEPSNIDEWTQRADQQNATLQAQRFTVMAAEKNIKVQSAQNLPVATLNGEYQSTQTTYSNNLTTPAPTVVSGTSQTISGPSYGVGLTLPIYAGGSISAQTEQAQYQYQGAVDLLEYTHRQTIASTRTAYLSVVAEISQIEADKQAVKSAAAALASNEAGYKVGTQTIVDVLTAQTNLYNAQTQYATDRYSYVNNTLALKQAAGTLNANDIDQINAWLTDEPYAAVAPKKATATPPVKPVKKVVQAVKKTAPQHTVKKSETHKKTAPKQHATPKKQPEHKPAVKKAPPATNNSSTDWNS